MANLTHEQKRACRDNPLAAYLAKRLPVMLALVGLIIACNLASIGLAALYALAHPLSDSGFVHLVAATLTVVMLVSGVVLALELNWMRRHQISPEAFDKCRPSSPPAVEPPSEPIDILAERLVQLLRREGSQHGRLHKAARTRMEAEYRRSVEIQMLALADMLHAGVKSLAEKEDSGFTGSNAGFRQLEATRELLQRVTRIAQAANRTLRAPNKKRLQTGDCRS